jgi:site-specific recombinase XerD
MNIIGHKYQDGDLKTEESYRNIPMSKRLKDMLLNIKEEKKKNYKSRGKKWNESDYVFLNQLEQPYTPERLQKKIQEFIKKYDLEHMTVYGFRHSYATLMSEKGMDREVLRELMGHAEFETTDFYYIHISEERKKREFERVHQETFQGKNTQDKGKKFYAKKKIKVLKSA